MSVQQTNSNIEVEFSFVRTSVVPNAACGCETPTTITKVSMPKDCGHDDLLRAHHVYTKPQEIGHTKCRSSPTC